MSSNVRHLRDPAPLQDLTPPHSLSAEQSVLGCLMLNPDAWDCISCVITEADFYHRKHRTIYAAIRALAEKNTPTDIVTLGDHLEAKGQLADVDGMPYLASIARDTPAVTNAEAYAEIIRDCALRRGVMQAANRIMELATTDLTPNQVLDKAQVYLSNLIVQGKGEPVRVKALLSDWLDQIDMKFQAGSELPGISTGIPMLDKMMDGWQPGKLYVVAGRPAMGKSGFVLTMLLRAVKQSKRGAIFSLEMLSSEILSRAAALLGRIDSRRIMRGQLADDEWARLTSATVALSDAPLYIDDTSSMGIDELRARARKIARQEGLDLLVVDYMQLLHAEGDNPSVQIGAISGGLKQLSKELNIPVIACSSLNRSLEQRADKRPIMSDLRESGKIEFDADVVIMLYRDEVYNPDTPDEGYAEILLRKHRAGPIGVVPVKFHKKYTLFEACSEPLPSWNKKQSKRILDEEF